MPSAGYHLDFDCSMKEHSAALSADTAKQDGDSQQSDMHSETASSGSHLGEGVSPASVILRHW